MPPLVIKGNNKLFIYLNNILLSNFADKNKIYNTHSRFTIRFGMPNAIIGH